MDLNSDLLKSYEKEWKTLGEKDKLIQLGKVRMLDEIRLFCETYLESLIRELKINQCENEEDCINPKVVEKNTVYKDPEIISIDTIKEQSAR